MLNTIDVLIPIGAGCALFAPRLAQAVADFKRSRRLAALRAERAARMDSRRS